MALHNRCADWREEASQKEHVPFSKTLPRLEELQLKQIWPIYAHDKDLLRYFPDVEQDKTPLKDYFFKS